MKYIVDNIKVSPLDKTSLNNIIAQRLNIKNFKTKNDIKGIKYEQAFFKSLRLQSFNEERGLRR